MTSTVGSYLARRLHQAGLNHHFAVAGDFNLVDNAPPRRLDRGRIISADRTRGGANDPAEAAGDHLPY